MRVLFTTYALAAGGAEKHLVRLARHLDRERFEVHVALARGDGPLAAELPDDVQVEVLSSGGSWSATRTAKRAVRPLRAWIEQQRPRVVYAVNDLAGVMVLQAVRPLASPPVTVLSVQNAMSRKYSGTLRPTSRWLLAQMRRFYPLADALAASSEGVARDTVRVLRCPEDSLRVLPNAGFDPADLPTLDEPLPRPRPPGLLVVACGRLVRQKGFDLLLEAFASVAGSLPVHLWILGEGPSRRALEERARRLDLQDRVWFGGFHERPMALMARADLFVLSSRWEGFGNVVVEAMACGTPVVVTDCPFGPAEIVEDGVSGLVVPNEDPRRLAEAMQRVLSDSELAQRLGDAGREQARSFSAQISADLYGDLFAELSDAKER